MSQTQPPATTTDATLPADPADPFADVRPEQVLRCRDPRTGWQWFYTRTDGQVTKYHERDGYAPRPTAETIVAETVALERVRACSVSEVFLEVYRGER